MLFFFDCIISTVTTISKNPCCTPSTSWRAMYSQAAFSPSPEDSVSIWMSSFKLCIVQQRLHVFDCRSECQWTHANGLAVVCHDIFTSAWTVLEDENSSRTLRSQTAQLISGTPQKTGKIKVAGLKGILAATRAAA